MARIIHIIDDDKSMSDIISDTLTEYGYSTVASYTLEEAEAVLGRQRVDLIILDISLPDGTGFEFCKNLREHSDVPIIFASARTMVDDRIRSLDIGGDDFLSKPYSLRELLSHVNALIRRTYGLLGEADSIVSFADVSVNLSLRTVTKGGQPVNLALREFDLLAYLIGHKNEATPNDRLLSEVWGAYSEVEPSTLTVHMRWLREKLEDDPANPKYLLTVRGVGYALKID